MNILYVALGMALVALGTSILMIYFATSAIERSLRRLEEGGREEARRAEVGKGEEEECGAAAFIAAVALPVIFTLLIFAVAAVYPQYALVMFALLPLVLLASALIALGKRGRVEGGAVVVVGPIPIVLSSSRSFAKVLILIALIAYLIFVAIILLYRGCMSWVGGASSP